jgi:hypothetical protein
VQRLIGDVTVRFGRLDVRVNDAAYNKSIPFPELDNLTLKVCDKIIALTGRHCAGHPVANFIREFRLWTALRCSSFRLMKETQAVLRTRSCGQDTASAFAFLDKSGGFADQIGSAPSARNAQRSEDTPEPVH